MDNALHQRQTFLIENNSAFLGQILGLLERIDDRVYSESPEQLAGQRAGSHIRHVLEVYEWFLNGLDSSHINYEKRRGDLTLESSREAAIVRIRSIIARLRHDNLLRRDRVVWVHIEGSESAGLRDGFAMSSTG